MHFLFPVALLFGATWFLWGLLPAVLVLVLAAEFVNGWTDAPNAIGTAVATRVLAPFHAVALAAVLNVVGALSGTAVAVSIGKGIVDPSVIDLRTVAGAMTGIILWSYLAWLRDIPTSESHALIAGLAGAGIATAGPHALVLSGWIKVLVGLGISTVIGFISGWLLSRSVVMICADWKPTTMRSVFSKLQIASVGFMALSHGSNDAQKFAGIAALALFLGGVSAAYTVPVWIILLCAAVMGAGTMLGGFGIIKNMARMGSVHEPDRGFAAETAAASSIIIASQFGIPLSTTQTINTAIMGVGTARCRSAIRWTIVYKMVLAWFLTFPACALISFVITLLLRLF